MKKSLGKSIGFHFVYLYRDEKGKPFYVGYGGKADRAAAHWAGSHNAATDQAISSRTFTLEVAGPFDSEATGRAVETAMISALHPECNLTQGESRWRFRPFGVPLAFADRVTEEPLELLEFVKRQAKPKRPVLFVRINSTDFAEQRGYRVDAPPNDEQLLQRVDRWWQLRNRIAKWSNSPKNAPKLLIGVYGGPGSQLVIASVLIDHERWNLAKGAGHGLVVVPVRPTKDLDAYGLRGYRIARTAGMKFGSFRQKQFRILDVDGKF